MQRRDFSTPARGCLRSDRDGFAADRNGAERPAYTFIHPLYALRNSFLHIRACLAYLYSSSSYHSGRARYP
jgi:hypothetical protein